MCYAKMKDDPREAVRAALHSVVDKLVDSGDLDSESETDEEVESRTPECMDHTPLPPEMKEELQSILQSCSGSFLGEKSPGDQKPKETSGDKDQSNQGEAKEMLSNEEKESFYERMKQFFRKVIDSFKKQIADAIELVWSWIKSILPFFSAA